MDDSDFEDFAAAAMPRLQRLALAAAGGNMHEANDLVQACLERMLLIWPKGDLDNPFAYARAVLVHELASQRRSARSHREHLSAHTDQLAPASDDLAGPATDSVMLLAALATLPRRQRHIVVLRYLEDLPVAEVCALLRCRPGTVKRASHVGLRTLRGLLTPSTEAFPPRGKP